MDVNVDLNEIIDELLEKNKALILENIVLRKALEKKNNEDNSELE
jgi:regulator of replication initiation timing